MLTKEEIKQFIEQDKCSETKQFASVGIRYYSGEHDIKDYRLFYYNADGNLVEDKTRSNIKISHPFFREIVDQAAQYLMSGENYFFKSDIPELQKELDSYFNYNDSFHAELYNLITDCMVEGCSYLYAYMGEDGKTHFQNADMLGIVEVRSNDASDLCDHVIYWYIERIDKGQTAVKRIQVWDTNQTFYYIQHDDGDLWEDPYQKINPRPHIIYTKEGDDRLFYSEYGCIPFFRLDNNRKRVSDLKSIKAIIDDYDLMNAGLSNNLQDASEYLVVIKGFAGENLDELSHNIRTKKIIGVDGDEGGDVDFKTVAIPYEARRLKMEEDEKNIYRFGLAFNSAEVGDGNITNVVIKSRYALLDMKCNKITIRVKALFRKLLDIVLQEINGRCGAKYQQTDVYFDFKREIITNSTDSAQNELIQAQTRGQEVNNILNAASKLDNDTVVKSICQILELDYEEVKAKINESSDEDVLQAIKQVEVE